jgi:hypothetical protein
MPLFPHLHLMEWQKGLTHCHGSKLATSAWQGELAALVLYNTTHGSVEQFESTARRR